VKFEGGLSISILRKKQPYEKKIGAQNRWVFKKVKSSKPGTTPPAFDASCPQIDTLPAHIRKGSLNSFGSIGVLTMDLCWQNVTWLKTVRTANLCGYSL
jgi:hypothetical protein